MLCFYSNVQNTLLFGLVQRITKTWIILCVYCQWCLTEEMRQDAPKFVFVTVTVLNMCIL